MDTDAQWRARSKGSLFHGGIVTDGNGKGKGRPDWTQEDPLGAGETWIGERRVQCKSALRVIRACGLFPENSAL